MILFKTFTIYLKNGKAIKLFGSPKFASKVYHFFSVHFDAIAYSTGMLVLRLQR